MGHDPPTTPTPTPDGPDAHPPSPTPAADHDTPVGTDRPTPAAAPAGPGPDWDAIGWLADQGLPPDTVVLIGPPQAGPPPMRPAACGLRVSAIDTDTTADHRPVLLAGQWEPGPRERLDPYSGDVLIELEPVTDSSETLVTVDLYLAEASGWQLAGHWPRLGQDWPKVIAPTAATVMRLHTTTLTGSNPHLLQTTPPE